MRTTMTTRKGRQSGKTSAKDRHSLNFVHLGKGREWRVESLPEDPKLIRALSLKVGNWLGSREDFKKPYRVPLIDSVGKFTGCTLYKASMNSQSFISTVISTISNRLRGWTHRHNSRINFKSKKYLTDLIVRTACIYSMTKNTYLMDRVLWLLKDFEKHKKSIAGVLAHFASKLDANKGFIYGQACSHAHWLTSRVSRPRDKSSANLHTFPLREVGVSDFQQRRVFIYDAIYVTAAAVAQICSIGIY